MSQIEPVEIIIIRNKHERSSEREGEKKNINWTAHSIWLM